MHNIDTMTTTLLESGTFPHVVWQTSADALALSDSQGTVVAANPAYLHLYGYTEDEVVGENFAIIFPEEYRAIAIAQYRQIFSSPHTPVPFESVIRCKDGSERVVESRAEFIEQDGQRVAMLSSIRDVTERVRQGEALRRSEVLFRHTFEGAPVGMALVGVDLKPVRANEALCKLLGYSEEEIIARGVAGVTHPDDVQADLRLAQQLLRGELSSYALEKRYITASGDIVWAQLSVALVKDQDGNPLYALSMLEDITARKKIEDERAGLLAKEHEARMLAEEVIRAQGELLSLVTHDLRNPTTVIKGVTGLLQRQLTHGKEVTADQLTGKLIMINNAVDRIERFLVDLSRPQHLHPGQPLLITPERVDLVALARRVAQLHQEQTKQHNLMVETQTPQLVGYWDPSRLEQVLDNLVSNAVKYSPEGGTVRISIGYDEYTSGDMPDVEMGDESAGGESNGNHSRSMSNRHAVIIVQDEGMGIPANDLPDIFEWYRRGTNVRAIIRGTGVGLAGARQIVEQHSGSITASSSEGAGSTFTVVLPLQLVAE